MPHCFDGFKCAQYATVAFNPIQSSFIFYQQFYTEMFPFLDPEEMELCEKDGWLSHVAGYESPDHVFRQKVSNTDSMFPQLPTETEAQATFENNFMAFQKYTAMYDVVAREGLERRTDRPPNDPTFENRDDRVIKKFLFRQRNLSYMIKHRPVLSDPDNEKENITPTCRLAIETISRSASQAGVLQETQNTSSRAAETSYIERQNEPLPGVGRITAKVVLEMIQSLLYTMDYKCIICSVQCFNYQTLKIHLRACHDRFIIKFEENPDRVIRISLNNNFDGSYELDPRNNTALTSPRKSISQRDGFSVMVSNELRNFLFYFNNLWGTNLDIQEFAYYIRQPGLMTDFRQYYHSQTCIPVLAHEIDIDSEDDSNADYTDWNIHRNIAQIDEFTDVNPGEKEIAKMWNLHLMRNSKMAIGECHIAKVVDLFIKLHEKAIAEKGLINNLVLHLCNLHSFGLVKARDVEKWIVQVRRIAARKAENAKNDKNGKIKNNSADESNQATVNGDDSSRVNDENSSVPSHENVVVNGLRR
ncbi:Polycomb protein suz12 [Tyrophagus putrescentiae]|nr:Polycomb protein suz12 [Tyrophagus putrescentiae]